jgi:hypothetical protein
MDIFFGVLHNEFIAEVFNNKTDATHRSLEFLYQ